MRIVCAVSPRGGAELVKRLVGILSGRGDWLVLHVIDTGLRHDLTDYLSGPLHRRSVHTKPFHEADLKAADNVSGRAAIEEAMAAAAQAGISAEARIQEGNPGEIIVKVAREMAADLVVIRAREGATGHPMIGPASVGHTARFVIDHAPCDVILVRDTERRQCGGHDSAWS